MAAGEVRGDRWDATEGVQADRPLSDRRRAAAASEGPAPGADDQALRVRCTRCGEGWDLDYEPPRCRCDDGGFLQLSVDGGPWEDQAPPDPVGMCEDCGGPGVSWEDGVILCDDCAILRAKRWQMDRERERGRG